MKHPEILVTYSLLRDFSVQHTLSLQQLNRFQSYDGSFPVTKTSTIPFNMPSETDEYHVRRMLQKKFWTHFYRKLDLNSDLTKSQKYELVEVLYEYRDISLCT